MWEFTNYAIILVKAHVYILGILKKEILFTNSQNWYILLEYFIFYLSKKLPKKFDLDAIFILYFYILHLGMSNTYLLSAYLFDKNDYIFTIEKDISICYDFNIHAKVFLYFLPIFRSTIMYWIFFIQKPPAVILLYKNRRKFSGIKFTQWFTIYFKKINFKDILY